MLPFVMKELTRLERPIQTSLMRRVLLITYYFPPSAAVGALRPAKFAKYLPQLGWNPYVLTAAPRRPKLNCREDSSSQVVRVRELPHPLKVASDIKRQRAKRRGQEGDLMAEWTMQFAEDKAASNRSHISPKRLLLSLLRIPDEDTGWIVPAILSGTRLIRRNDIRALWTTGPPFSCHLVGLVLKYLHGVRWIADFRDPGSLEYKSWICRNRVVDALEAWLIRAVMTEAD